MAACVRRAVADTSRSYGAADGKIYVPEVIPGSLQKGFEWEAFLCYAGPSLLICTAYIDPVRVQINK
jgi:hypothetical protein